MLMPVVKKRAGGYGARRTEPLKRVDPRELTALGIKTV